MNSEEFKKFISHVDGYCAEEDCYQLYSLVKELDLTGDLLDVGAFKGRISISLARALKDTHKNDRVYAIDANLFESKNDLLKNIAYFKLKDQVIPLFGSSAYINIRWKAPLKFIWVDTDGNYLSGKCDFLLWEPFLLTGGVIAFGCAHSEGIKRIVKDCIVRSNRFGPVKIIGSIIFACKEKEEIGYPQRKRLWVRIVYTLYYLVKKINYNLNYRIFPRAVSCFKLKKLLNNFFENLLKS